MRMRIDEYSADLEGYEHTPPAPLDVYIIDLQAHLPVPQSADELAVIDDKELVVKEMLGAGKFGEVWLASWREFPEVAVKIPLRRDNVSRGNFTKEVQLMQRLNSPLILKCHHFYLPNYGVPYAILEYCAEGNLTGRLSIIGKYSLVDKLNISKQLADALVFIHDHEIIHLDIKPDNILLDSRGIYKIADFGLAIEEKSADKYSKKPLINGTALWMAPEVLFAPFTVDYKNDVWSMSVVFWQMAVGLAEPYPEVNNLCELRMAINSGILTGIENVEKNFRKIIEDGRKINYLDRSTARMIAHSLSGLLQSFPQELKEQLSETVKNDCSSHSPNFSVSAD